MISFNEITEHYLQNTLNFQSMTNEELIKCWYFLDTQLYVFEYMDSGNYLVKNIFIDGKQQINDNENVYLAVANNSKQAYNKIQEISSIILQRPEITQEYVYVLFEHFATEYEEHINREIKPKLDTL